MTNSTQDTDRISREEMVEMFGSEMPIEAVNLLWGSDGSKTCGELRVELRRIAKARPSQDTEDVVARLVAHGRKHGALLNADNEAWDAIDAMLADRQSLSDRIDVLEGALSQARVDILVTLGACRDDMPSEAVVIFQNIADRVRVALHQEGIAP